MRVGGGGSGAREGAEGGDVDSDIDAAPTSTRNQPPPRNPVEALASALASLVASLSPADDEREKRETKTAPSSSRGESGDGGHWRSRSCFPSRLPTPSPTDAAHDLATTGSRVFPLLGRPIAIYDFGVYVDADALGRSSSAGALRAAAPAALASAAAEGGGKGDSGSSGAKKKRRNLSRFVPVLPRVISGRRERRRQKKEERKEEERPQLPSASYSSDLDLALPFGAALRSADDVPMSLVVRSRRALPIALLRAEYARILSRRIQRLGGDADDRGLREMLSHFRVDALPRSARHRGIFVSGFGNLAGLAGVGGIREPSNADKVSSGGGALAKGAVIEFHRAPGGTLSASVDGEHVATVRSAPLLAAAVFDLYVGEEPVCGRARASAHEAVAAWVSDSSLEGGKPPPSWFAVGGGKRENKGDERTNRSLLLAGGPRARATSGAAVCDDDESDEERGPSCKLSRERKRKDPKKEYLG